MNRRLLFMTLIGIASASSLSAQDRTSVALPSNKSTAIVVMDFRGGYGPPRKNNSPVLTVQANGKATVVDPMGERPTISHLLTAAEVQDLMQSIVVEQDFFGIDRSEISKAIAEEDRKTGTRHSISDASTTVLRITTADRNLELRFDALGMWAKRYPLIQPLARLFNVRKRLDRLIAEFTPGAHETILAALEATNTALKQEHPGTPPMELTDFDGTGRDTGGNSTTRFVRVQSDRSRLVSTVTVSPGMPPQVTIRVEERQKICFGDSNDCMDL